MVITLLLSLIIYLIVFLFQSQWTLHLFPKPTKQSPWIFADPVSCGVTQVCHWPGPGSMVYQGASYWMLWVADLVLRLHILPHHRVGETQYLFSNAVCILDSFLKLLVQYTRVLKWIQFQLTLDCILWWQHCSLEHLEFAFLSCTVLSDQETKQKMTCMFLGMIVKPSSLSPTPLWD